MRVGRDTVTCGMTSISGKERVQEVKFRETSSGGSGEVGTLAVMANSYDGCIRVAVAAGDEEGVL